MKILSKQFEDLVTAWRRNEFFKARIKLTVLYVLMVAVILGLFSGFILYGIGAQFGEIDDHFESYEDQGDFSKLFLEEFTENLLVTDILILLFAGLLSFWLAGKTLRPIKETLQRHEQFSVNVAHELRTPLAALYASAGAALRNPGTEAEHTETLTDIKQETRRLIDLTERLLTTTHGEEVHTLQPLSCDALVKNILKKIDALAEQKGVTISFETEPLAIMGYAQKLEELFFNLLHNAIKFSHSGGTIAVEVRKNGSVTVKDYGLGISAEALPHVFERFYTTDTARDERGKHGTGLGLAIAAEIAAEHNARIRITSELGKGTAVTVSFTPVA